MTKRYVIECRDEYTGRLDFVDPQPAQIFGMEAITGITASRMAQIVRDRVPDAVLHGMNMEQWPAWVDRRWRARIKYWEVDDDAM